MTDLEKAIERVSKLRKEKIATKEAYRESLAHLAGPHGTEQCQILRNCVANIDAFRCAISALTDALLIMHEVQEEEKNG